MSATLSAVLGRTRIAEAVPIGRALSALLWLMLGANALFLTGLVAAGGTNTPIVSVWLSLFTQWIPVAILWLVVARTGLRRMEVLLATVGVTLSALGDTYYSLAMDENGFLAFPSPADFGYLMFYPLMGAALAVLVHRQLKGATAIVYIECAVASLGAAAVLAVIVDPIVRDAVAGDNVFDSSVALAYPLFDLVLLAAMAGVAASPTANVGSRSWSLAVGLGIFTAADIAYALLEHHGTYLAGMPIDAAWAIGLAFITWWVVGAGTEVRRIGAPAPKSLAVPITAIAVLAGLAVLIVGTQIGLSTLAIVLASLTVGFAAVPIMFRQAMLGRLLTARGELVQQLTELDRSKTDMMVTVNHEFTKPLAAINSHVATLLDGERGDLRPAAVQALRVIEDNGARLEHLVAELLETSRLEAGILTPALKPLYLSGMLTRAAASANTAAKAYGVDVAVECDNFALVVDADGGQLERAFSDLVENAVKFSPRGTVRVLAEPDVRQGEVTVRIIDDGMGIPSEDLPRLFTRFFRAGNVVTTSIPGVGLGLSIAQHVVAAHGGSIAITSTLGAGTTVSVRLPLARTGVPIPQFGVRA